MAKRKQATQRCKQLTRRQSALLEHIRAGMTFSKAALAAGYSRKWPGQACYQALKNIERKRPKIFYELGLTVEAVIERLKTSENI